MVGVLKRAIATASRMLAIAAVPSQIVVEMRDANRSLLANGCYYRGSIPLLVPDSPQHWLTSRTWHWSTLTSQGRFRAGSFGD